MRPADSNHAPTPPIQSICHLDELALWAEEVVSDFCYTSRGILSRIDPPHHRSQIKPTAVAAPTLFLECVPRTLPQCPRIFVGEPRHIVWARTAHRGLRHGPNAATAARASWNIQLAAFGKRAAYRSTDSHPPAALVVNMCRPAILKALHILAESYHRALTTPIHCIVRLMGCRRRS